MCHRRSYYADFFQVVADEVDAVALQGHGVVQAAHIDGGRGLVVHVGKIFHTNKM